MACDVDVVVVGGSTGAVAAAVEAARAGAKVFLAAPRPYLGTDMCGTLRMWLEPGEEPTTDLARAVYAPPAQPAARGTPFKYEADRRASPKHSERRGNPRLTDGRMSSAPQDSLQFDGDVVITADLGREREVKAVHVLVYQRNGDFEVETVRVAARSDGGEWRELASIRNRELGKGSHESDSLDLAANVRARARHLRFDVRKSARAGRVLLAEIAIETEDKPAPEGGADVGPPPPPPTPMHVKRTLDRALLDAGVDFRFGSLATDALRDAEGNLAGIVIANRGGRQAVRAKVVIDATDRAWFARLAGAEFRPHPGGRQTFRRVVVGGKPRAGSGVRARDTGVEFVSKGKAYPVVEYELEIPLKDGGFASLMEAEHVARDMTWDPKQVDESEILFQVPPDPLVSRRASAETWRGAGALDLGCMRPTGTDSLYVLGGCADVPREAAAKLVRPVNLMELGGRVGRAAAEEAKRLPPPGNARVAGTRTAASVDGEVRELLTGTRPFAALPDKGLPGVDSPSRALPVFGEYDVVVIGGGTGGAPAGIGAARTGARTLVIEYLHGLGGVGTLGLIGKYYHGYRGGFTAEHDRGVKKLGAAVHVIGKAEWWRRENRKAGAEVWFGTLGCGALVEDGKVKGAIVATPEGRGVVLAGTVIDSTGNSDVAAAAGAECTYTDGTHVAVQGTGLPPRDLGASYTNSDYTFADDTDVTDTWHLFVLAREKFKDAYDLGQIVDTRERRRIVGDYCLTPVDMMLGRTYPDTFVMSKSNFDSHGYTVHPFFLLRQPDRQSITVYTPYRCLIPRDLEGMLVTGLGVSAHRDAIPVIRMQPDIQNQGYAAGMAAAMAARSGKGVRGIDLKAIQRKLVEIGNIPAHCLTDTDSFPLPRERIERAVRDVVKGYRDLAVLLASEEQSLPMLKRAYADSVRDTDRVVYAHILGMLGDATGVGTLVERVRGFDRLDMGWNYTGMGQFGMSLSPLDSYMMALGRTRDRRALAPILEKLAKLSARSEFSHHRAAAAALEALGDPAAALPLHDLLSKPGMRGHAVTDVADSAREGRGGKTETGPRNESLKELVVARALYRCGDHEGLGERTLREYARDLRGHYARHARAILAEER
ncbi:MAG: FAD-dependent oxidoreductase [Planctomycetota bacterium]|jgi:flavin-dependent dehydrogenase